MTFRELTVEKCEEMFSKFGERMKIHEAAELLCISVSKLRRLVREGKIPADDAGKWHIFHKSILIDYYLSVNNKKIREVNKIYER